MSDELHHPCKQTCSGWQQGFDAGARQLSTTTLELLRWCDKQIQPPKEGDNRFEHSRRMYAGLKALLTVNRKVK
jgi:hypothetical protein